MLFITVISVVLLEELATEFNITLRVHVCVCVCVLFPVINVSLLQQYSSVIYFLLCIF